MPLLRSRHGSAQAKKPNSEDFRAHFGFLALMLVCFACVVYLMGALRSIFRPFLWALFLVMVLGPAVSLVESILLCLGRGMCRCGAGTWNAVCWVLGCLACSQQPRLDKARLRRSSGVAGSPGRDAEGPGPSVVIGSAVSAEHEDRIERPPADGGARPEAGAVSDSVRSSRSADSRVDGPPPCIRMLIHGVAIAIVVAAVVCAVIGFVLMVVQSVLNLQENWPVYKKGAENVAQAVQKAVAHATGSMPKSVAEDISRNALEKAEEVASAIVGEVLGNAWRTLLEFLMMALYIAFWLSAPMPLGSKMEELFRRYILLKGLACLGYGLCVGTLLGSLGVDLSPAFGLFAFLLSFVPEVGAIVALLLPAPVILFDSRLESPAMTLFIATASQLGLKFVFANVVEVKLVEADQLMKMHPVIILLAVTFFGFIWGPTGMLLAVPLVAYFKAVLLSDSVPACYRDPVLVVLEGDLLAPRRYLRKQLAGLDTQIEMIATPEADTAFTEVAREDGLAEPSSPDGQSVL